MLSSRRVKPDWGLHACHAGWCQVAVLIVGVCPQLALATVATPDHVVVVIEENQDYDQIIGSPDAPYLNQLAGSGLSFLNSRPLVLHSIVNYLDLFSGSNQGVTD